MFIIVAFIGAGSEMSTVRPFIYRFLTKLQSAEIATASATISFLISMLTEHRYSPNDIPHIAEVRLLFIRGVGMGARVRRLPWFNSLYAFQP
jgi:hypothetical protein